ncbi:uncharacterized protein LOC107036919 isoform X2 [Diachasma alloeum]|uniref:uncharacterized protein LOC107036919 isoform X2 n=1 Tax=Diachasma alloeum TaxID=454923 RepID=UPI0007381036|nr:uncharacterized protein LOC107036919 isoform X2 [Diachasma alloeum]
MMARCAFSGCKSGTTAVRNLNKALGVRNESLFRVPNRLQNAELRKKWEEALGREARDKEVVCALHFSEGDIRTNYEIPLTKDVKFVLKRGTITLKSTAVPKARINNNVEEKEKKTSQATSPSPEAPPPGAGGPNPPEMSIKTEDPGLNTTETVLPADTATKMETDCRTSDKENSQAQENVRTNSLPLQGEEEKKSSQATAPPPEALPPQAPVTNLLEMPIKTEYPSLNTETILPEDTSVKMETDCCISSENEMTAASAGNKTVPASYENPLERLRSELEDTPLPDGWVHLLLKNHLMIGHFTGAGHAKKEFYIQRDGGVQVYFNSKSVYVESIRPGVTVTNVLNNIKILQPLLLCDGVGINDRCCDDCKGYVAPVLSYIKFGHVRCKACATARQRIYRLEMKHARMLRKLEALEERDRKNLRNERRKNQRLKALCKKFTPDTDKS